MMEFKDKAVLCSDYIEMVHKIEIKGEPWWPEQSREVNIPSEEPPGFNIYLPSDKIMAVNSKEDSTLISSNHKTCIQTEVKQEPLWLEKTSTERKCQSEEAVHISHLNLQNDIKKRFAQIRSKSKEVADVSCSTFQDAMLQVNVAARHLPATEPSGYTKAACHNDSSVSTLLTAGTLEKTRCLNAREENSECEDSEDVTEASLTEKQPYKCVRCGRRYLYASQLERHSLVHEGKGACTCTLCGKSFSQYSYLNQHYLMHEGKGLYKCKVCEKNFTKLSNLKAHSLIHGGTKPYSCEICKQSFNHVYALKRHKLFHEGKKSHRCEVCEKSFIQLSDLNRHKLIHEGKKPFKCEICQRSFTQRSSLKMHKRVHSHKTT